MTLNKHFNDNGLEAEQLQGDTDHVYDSCVIKEEYDSCDEEDQTFDEEP